MAVEINRKNVEAEARKILKGKTWKEYLIIGVVCLVMLGLLNSGIAYLALGLAQIFFLVVGLFYLGKALYFGFPEWKKMMDDKKKK